MGSVTRCCCFFRSRKTDFSEDFEGYIVNESAKTIKLIRENVERTIVGREAVVDLLLTAVVCSGHILLEDVPGLGKTSLAKSLAKSINCDFRRIQFTPDLLPADLTGILHILSKDDVLPCVITAEAIAESLAGSFSEAGPDIRSLTVMYEETRYGRKQPTDEEYREFKKKVGHIVEIVGELH